MASSHERHTILVLSSAVGMKLEAVEMMKYLPEELRDSFEQLWKKPTQQAG